MKAESGLKKLFSFFRDVKGEVLKVSWPSRGEVTMITIVVFVLAIFAALFFSVVDTFSYKIVHWIIGI